MDNSLKHNIMRKIFVLLIISLSTFLHSQIFKEPYYYVGSDEMHVYKQSNDTLYKSNTFSLQPVNIKKYNAHYKIWDIIEKPQNLIAVKLESLDSIPLTTDPYPEDRFKLLLYKKISEKELLLIRDINHLKQEEMTTYNIDTIQTQNSYGMTLFSLSYLKQLSTLKKVKSKKDANAINNELNNSKYTRFAESYVKFNRLSDPYASILSASLINTACINLGYSPIGASFSINTLNTDRRQEKKKKIIDELYKMIYDK